MIKQNKQLVLAIALALTAGGMPAAEAQTAADFQDDEYYASGGLDIINAAEAYALGYTGKGITLGICDQPINFLSPEFNTKLSSRMVNFSTYKGGSLGIYNWTSLPHGTHVAGIAAGSRNGIGMQGVAYEAEIAGASMLADYPMDKTFILRSNLYEGFLQNSAIKVINNSWGPDDDLHSYGIDVMGYEAAKRFLRDDDVHYVAQAAQAVDAGKLLVFAAGNAGHTTGDITMLSSVVLPQTAGGLLNVTNLNNEGVVRDSSGGLLVTGGLMTISSDLAKYMEDATLAAPGKSILSAAADFSTTGRYDMKATGTSMSAPFVTGAGALVQQAFPYMNGKQLGDVLLSTANTKITMSNLPVVSVQTDLYPGDSTTYTVGNVFYRDGAARSSAAVMADMLAYYRQNRAMVAEKTGFFSEEKWETFVEELQKYGALNVYYNVPLEALVGQGVLDVGAAVRGPGALNARRLTAADISSSYTIAGMTGQQALYSVDTQGYDSVWSNNIKEIRVDHIAADSSEADLQARYAYYYTNWLGYTGTKRDTAKKSTAEYIADFNQQVDAGGLRNLPVGLYKAGTGTLTLAGVNTYQGSSIAAGGTLAINGSVAGDAWSVKNISTGTTGAISGAGTIKGNLYNHGTAYPSQSGNLTVNGTLTSDGAIGLATAADGQSSHQLMIDGAANINGSTLQRVNGSS